MRYEKLTPQKKDEALIYLMERGGLDALVRADVEQMCLDLDLSNDDLHGLFSIFIYDGMISGFNDRRTAFLFLISPKVKEWLQKGGYTAESEILHKNIALLDAELKNLKPALPLETFERMTTIIANIYGFFA